VKSLLLLFVEEVEISKAILHPANGTNTVACRINEIM
jgi:hypothetical protein